MTLNRARFSTVIFPALVTLALAIGARAEDVWRMAGTMNGWNQADAAWAMAPVGDAEGVVAIERVIEKGEYRFKFVRNGHWGGGHFGAGRGGRLEQPGDDIVLRIPATAKFRIALDTGGASWTMRAVDLAEPIVVARIQGTPIMGEPLLVDCSRSLTNNPHEECRMLVWAKGEMLRTRRSKDGTLRWLAFPQRPGTLEVHMRVVDGRRGGEATVSREIEVANRYMYTMVVKGDERLEHPLTRRNVLIEAVSPGIFRKLIEVTEAVEIAEMEITTNTKGPITDRNFTLEPGTWCMEVVDGVITTHRDVPGHRLMLAPGNWTRFAYLPPSPYESADTVHLTGDMNDWAAPGDPRSAPLLSILDGRFTTILDFPDGVYAYQLVLDGTERVVGAERPTASLPGRGVVSVLAIGPWGDAPPEAKPGHIYADGVFHDPLLERDVRSLSPELGLIDVSVVCLADDAKRVAVVYEDRGTGERVRVPMRRSARLDRFDLYSARLRTGEAELSYSFELTDGDATHTTETYTTELGADRLQTPDWAMGAVWYQVFPERFRNGNPLNDPHGPGVFNMPWTADWYKAAPGEREAHAERYDLAPGEPLTPTLPHDNLFHWVFDRRYGGDLQGVVEKLDYLEALGVDAIYFNPVFEAESLHKYDATDYRHIDDNLGAPASAGRVAGSWDPPEEGLDPETWTWTAADRWFVDVLLPAAHERGMRVVVDGVFNHTGRSFFAFQDVMENGADSAYADWYYVEFDEAGELDSWTAWDGPSGWLPKFRQTEEGDLVAPVKRHLMDITARWMDPDGDGDPSDGIDGWRLDVPLDIGQAQGCPFWKSWRRHVKSINPDAIIIAEIWDEADAWMRGQHFDTQMHYPFAKPVTNWLGVDPEMTSAELGAELSRAFNDAPQTNLIHQNLMTSHDTDRYVSKLFNPGRGYDEGNRLQDLGANLRYKESKPPKAIYDRSLLGLALQATYVGAPMIYYGQEIGMWGADDPSDRKPYPWPDLGPNENPDDNPVEGLLEAYQRWFNLRHDPEIGPILRYGSVHHLKLEHPDVFGFVRSLNGKSVYVIVNRGSEVLDASAVVPGTSGDRTVGPVSARYWVVDD